MNQATQNHKVRGVYERDPRSGIWWICWFDQFGKRHREKVGRRSAAIDAYQKRKNQVREGKFFPELLHRQLRFKHLCDDAEKRGLDRVSKTRMALVRTWFGERFVASITPLDIQQKLSTLEEQGRAPATLNRYRALLSSIFSWAIENSKAQTNPALKVPMRRENNARIRFLEQNEEARLRKAARKLSPYADAELDLALHTGMRRGSQYSLRWNQVDFKRGVITLLKTKNGEIQHIPLNRVSRSALLALRGRHEELVCPEDSREWFETARAEARLENFRWHDLRHTFASRLVMAGVNLRAVQELLGHKNIAMTLRYAHLARAHTHAAVACLTATRTATSPRMTVKMAKEKSA